MIFAVAQPVCAARDVAANAVAHADAVRRAGARVVVFPELSLTGYELDAAPLAPDDDRLAPLVAACAETGTLALAGAPVPGPHIATLAVTGGDVRVVYRKMRLGAAEAERFAPGDEPGRVVVDGVRIGLAICKDTGDPAHAAATAARGVDVYAAGIVHAADEADVHPARARRIATTHGVPVALASFAGPTGGGYTRTAGNSGIWSPTGALLAHTDATPGTLATAEL